MRKDGQWATSTNGETFNGEEFATKQEAIDYMNNDLDVGDTFWVGQIETLHVAQFVDAESLVERTEEMAYERVGEAAENWLYPFPKEEYEELHDLITKWFEDKGYKPTFCAIQNVEQHVAK